MTESSQRCLPLGEATPRQTTERTATDCESWPPVEHVRRVGALPQFQMHSDHASEPFTLGVECRHSELEDK